MGNRIYELSALKEAVERAEHTRDEFLKSAWPVGSEVHFEKRGCLQVGQVLGHNRDCLRVENIHTGKTYWVDTYWVRP